MKILVTEERECCTHKDLIHYSGIKSESTTGDSKVLKLLFCKYCGQLWKEDTYTDAAGGSSTGIRKVTPGQLTGDWLR